MPTDLTQISVLQYVQLGLTVVVPLGILAVIIVIAYPAIEKWRVFKLHKRMIELKTKHQRE